MVFAQEPPRTNYDVNFVLGRIPIRVHPLFWLVTVLLGGLSSPPREVLIWVIVCFVSILVHELGHAVAILRYGWRPWIVLYAMGGLALHESSSPWQAKQQANSPQTQIVISLAGPGAGIALGFLTAALIWISGRSLAMNFFGADLTIGRGPSLSGVAESLAADLLWLNICWSLVNLLPIYPLDGGQVAREVLLATTEDGYHRSLRLSLVAAAAVALFFLLRGELFGAILFGMLAYNNYQMLARGSMGGGPYSSR